MNILPYLRKKYNEIIDPKCREIGQRINFSLGRLNSKSVILCIEKKTDLKGEKCDCIIITDLREIEKIIISFVELKSGRGSLNKIILQLQGCANYLENVIRNDKQFLNHLKKKCAFFAFYIFKASKGVDKKAAKQKKTTKKGYSRKGLEQKILLSPKKRIRFFNSAKIIRSFKYITEDNKSNITLEYVFENKLNLL